MKKEKLDRIVSHLQQAEPRLGNPERLAEEVMQSISPGRTYQVEQILFGWTRIGWVRNVLSTAAVILVAVFMFQFISLNRKIARLEKQWLPSTYRFYESPYMMDPDLIDFLPRDLDPGHDSIKISRRDLIELLNSSRRQEILYQAKPFERMQPAGMVHPEENKNTKHKINSL